MSIVNTILQTRATERQNGEQNMQRHVDRGLSGVVELGKRQDAAAAASRPLNPQLSKFLNMMMAKKMSPSMAAKAYQAAKAGHISFDVFDADPNTPGIQAPTPDGHGAGLSGGAAPRMPGAPGYQTAPNGPVTQGPVNQQYTPQSQGGLAMPGQFQEEVQAPQPQISNHQWTAQEAQDFQNMGGLSALKDPSDTPEARMERVLARIDAGKETTKGKIDWDKEKVRIGTEQKDLDRQNRIDVALIHANTAMKKAAASNDPGTKARVARMKGLGSLITNAQGAKAKLITKMNDSFANDPNDPRSAEAIAGYDTQIEAWLTELKTLADEAPAAAPAGATPTAKKGPTAAELLAKAREGKK